MSDSKVEYFVDEIVKIEKDAMRKKFDAASGLGKQFAKDKTDSDVINKILTLMESEDERDEN